MSQNRTVSLPDGTDTVIEGAARSEDGDTLTVEDTALVKEKEITTSRGGSRLKVSDSDIPGSQMSGSSIVDRFRSGSEQLSNQAGEKARGIVSQGLERTAEALANVSKMIGDTAPGIEERLGSEYGDYARRAAGAIENAASTVASKDPDELIEDTRNFVRNSPGIALAGAAVVGFVLARVLKSGLAASRGENDED